MVIRLSRILIPDPSLILLIGPSGAGKSTFARKHFGSTEIVSSDRCRQMIIDDEANQDVSGRAFSLLRHIADSRLHFRRLTVIDATNLDPRGRRSLLRMAESRAIPAIAIVFEVPLERLIANNAKREGRSVPQNAIVGHVAALERTNARIEREGYAHVYRLNESMIESVEVERTV